jgi:transcriptional regulator with XRE-family HTH domain
VVVTECQFRSTIAAMKAAEKIAWLCRERGLTQKRVGELAALPENRISKWLDGQGEPTARQALRLARVLDVPMDWLVDDEADVPPPDPGLSPAELRAVEMTRALNLDASEVIRRMSHPTTAVVVDPDDPMKLLGTIDLTEITRRRLANHMHPDEQGKRPKG